MSNSPKFLLLIICITLIDTASFCRAEPAFSRDLALGLYDKNIQSRSISPENPTGEPGKGGMTEGGRKGNPYILQIKDQEQVTLASIQGLGAIRHMWMTFEAMSPNKLRNLIFRIYWDDQKNPSVETPLGDFFGFPFGVNMPIFAEYISSPEGRSLTSSFYMPFKKNARVTITNDSGEPISLLYFQIDYTLGDTMTDETPYFHAQFKRNTKTKPGEDFIILDRKKTHGRYLGAFISVVDLLYQTGTWWGEGEVKVYLDGDKQYPTIVATGIEDYALSGWSFKQFSQPESGVMMVDGPRNAFYRFHTKSPIYFHNDIKVTMQQLGNMKSFDPVWIEKTFKSFKDMGMFAYTPNRPVYERSDDVSAVAYWYQSLPTELFAPFPTRAVRSIGIQSTSWQ